MRSQTPRWLRPVMLGIFIIIIVGLVRVNYQLSVQIPGGNDFLARWAGAHYWLVEDTNPYEREVSLAAQRMFYGRLADPTKGESLAHFYYPLYSMVFFAPFGLAPFPIARAIWMTLLEIALPVLLIMGIRIARWEPTPPILAMLMMFSIIWYPGVRSIFVGQFAVIESLLITGALLAIHRGKDPLAGILLALSTSKPQMPVLLIPLILLWAASRRNWRLILWAAGAQIALFVGSLLLIPDWPLRWLWQVVDYAQYTKPGYPVSILASAFPNSSQVITIVLTGLFLLYLILEWVVALRKDERWFQWTAAMTIVITNIVAFRTATTNYTVMLPALCLIFSVWSKRWGNKGNLGVILVTLLLGIGLWALFLTTISGNDESLVMYLPLPFLTFFGLLWVRWWAIFPRKLPLEGSVRERVV